MLGSDLFIYFSFLSKQLVGSLLQYSRWGPYDRLRYHLALVSMHRQYGPLVRERIGWGQHSTVLHVFDPDDIKTVRVSLVFPSNDHFVISVKIHFV